MQNTGKPSEKIFDDFWTSKGKRAFNFKFADSSSLTGLNGKMVQALAQPSDRLVVYNGNVEFAEVKSTHDETAFRFSMLRKKQKAFAAFALAAGGTYTVYVHRIPTDEWFKIPYQYILYVQSGNVQSIPWEQLQSSYRWNRQLV